MEGRGGEAPECTGAEGVKSSHPSLRAEKPGDASGKLGAGSGKEAVTVYFQVCRKAFFFFFLNVNIH